MDVLQGLAHPARPCGLQPLSRKLALDLQLRIRQARLVPEPHVLRVPQHRPVPGLGLPDLVDGFVGVPDHMEPVDDPMRVGQVLADALGEPRAHVASDQPHVVRVAVVVHEVAGELLDGVRVLAGDHADHVAPRQVGDHGDVPVAFAASLVDADGLHARVVLVEPGLVHVMADEPPQPRVVLTDLRRDVRHRLRLGAGRRPWPRTGARTPLPGLAHGIGTVLTPWAWQATRGTSAWMWALYWKKSEWRHARSAVS